MKRCPSCSRNFDDEALRFCPHDGSGLEPDVSTPPAELQATMMATPSSMGGVSFPPPPAATGSESGSFKPPTADPSWARPAAPADSSPSRKSGGINKKLLFGGLGCLGLAVIVGIVGIVVLFAFSGPSSKMNPYKGDLKELVPETMGIYKRVDVDVLKDRDKEGFGAVSDAIGVAYKDNADAKVEMFVGNYATAKDAEAGLESFKNQQLGRGFSSGESGSKKIGWSSVGKRFTISKDAAVGKAIDRDIPNGAKIILAQEATPAKSKKLQFVGWTNGSVVFVVAGEESEAIDFEKAFDANVK